MLFTFKYFPQTLALRPSLPTLGDVFGRQRSRLVSFVLVAITFSLAAPSFAQSPAKELGTVTVSGGRPTSLPTQIPTTIEGISGQKVEQTINASDSEDALKYLPSLLVRKRFIGDYDHAVLATRASGTGNSARSLVFADGILLSNLLGNGASFTPRWGMVTPEEIDRVDVLYGPFSAAYSGHSVGAVVDYVTRMPSSFESHAKISTTSQNFSQYGSSGTFGGKQLSASVGDRVGHLAWWLNLSRLESDGQPIAFANRLVSAGTVSSAGTAVTGAIADRNPRNQDWLLLGSTSQTHTVQDHAKFKVAYDITPTLRASYTLGWWTNDAARASESYLRNVAGQAVYSGNVNINGRQYALNAADFAPSRAQLEHYIHGLSIKSNSKGTFDWEFAASLYDYSKDQVRSPLTALPSASSGGAGRLTDLSGTGWTTLALKGVWRPQGYQGAHLVDFGVQQDSYRLRSLVSETSDWLQGSAGALNSAFRGNTQLTSLYAQDTWKFAPDWRATLGARLEQWRASGGALSNATSTLGFTDRKETAVSPKAAVAYQANKDWTFKASLGRAVRNPTVSELYQGAISANVVINNDPNLKPEKSWTSEWSAERALSNGTLRFTAFFENTEDALYSQTNVTVTPNVVNIQNVDRIRTSGLEMAYQASDVGLQGVELMSSITFARSIIVQNDKFPASVGMSQPRVPQWRANLVASYRPDEHWSYTLGLRYSGKQFGALDNGDTNSFAYTGFSSFFVADVRVRYRFNKQWSLALGVDNLNNAKYWAFHPYTQRTYSAEAKFSF
jgi:iron complex outermembrane recepter protein